MKAIAIYPSKPDSVHLVELPVPQLEDVPDGRGVLVRMLRVGLDGTDREIKDGEYGAAPPGYDFLVMGHESFGIVEGVGLQVTELAPGDFVVGLVRRPGNSIYDVIGRPDMAPTTNTMNMALTCCTAFSRSIMPTSQSTWCASRLA